MSLRLATSPISTRRSLTPAVQDEDSRSAADDRSANIVIFGTTGVGKSSVINLIAGRELASTSDSALGCTFQHKRHPVSLGSEPYALWDTPGLNEGSQGTVPAGVAETCLRKLMLALMYSGGIHLIIYCIRGNLGRLTETHKRNYDLFYTTTCWRKVPIALVVTGLEHQEGDMETWWTANEATLLQNGMHFHAHACVTTVTSTKPVIQKRVSDSRERLLELVAKFSVRQDWNPDSSLSQLTPSTVRDPALVHTLRNTTVTRRVIVCDTFAELSPEASAVWTGSTVQICDRQYELLQVDKHDLQTDGELRGWPDAAVLVFHASTLVDGCISGRY